MSVKNQEKVQCSKCGNEQETTIWSSLNVSFDLEEKSKLFDGKINKFICESCGSEAFIPVPFLYHDMQRKFCVQFFPPESLKKHNFFDQFTLNGKMKIKEDLGFEVPEYMTDIQIAFDINELIKYVLFRELLYEKKVKQQPNSN